MRSAMQVSFEVDTSTITSMASASSPEAAGAPKTDGNNQPRAEDVRAAVIDVTTFALKSVAVALCSLFFWHGAFNPPRYY